MPGLPAISGKSPPPGWPICRCRRPRLRLLAGSASWLSLPASLGCNFIGGIERVQCLLIVQSFSKLSPGGSERIKNNSCRLLGASVPHPAAQPHQSAANFEVPCTQAGKGVYFPSVTSHE